MTVIYVVLADTQGAHESDDVMSLWTDRSKAEAEVARLEALRETAPLAVDTTYGGYFHVKEWPVDTSSNSCRN